MYKLLALNIDGTLLKSNGKLEKKTKEAIDFVKKKDVYVTLMTSRNFLSAKKVAKAVKREHDMLKTIKTFFECNLNVSLAAKKLHMHRNSLQYRIDKFIEKTSIDIKQFKGALTVYLAILLHEHH